MPTPSPSWKARRRCAPHQLGPPCSSISTRSPCCTAQAIHHATEPRPGRSRRSQGHPHIPPRICRTTATRAPARTCRCRSGDTIQRARQGARVVVGSHAHAVLHRPCGAARRDSVPSVCAAVRCTQSPGLLTGWLRRRRQRTSMTIGALEHEERSFGCVISPYRWRFRRRRTLPGQPSRALVVRPTRVDLFVR
jgi:hypothetical protein